MDDMGIGDSRAYNKNSKISMPNLEKMAEQGMTFTDAHAPAAVCAPTRYSVMTGNYPWRGRNPNGTWLFNMPSQIMPGQKSIGQLMKKAGYKTAFLGKVHLGGKIYSKLTGKPKLSMKDGFQDFDFSRKIEDTPASLGFDYAYELPQGIQGSPYISIEDGMLVGEESKLKDWKAGTYGNSVIEADGFGSPEWDSSKAGPLLTGKAISFLNRHFTENQSTGIRKPFFMYYNSQSCHVPHTPPNELGGEKIKGAAIDSHLDMIVEADVTLGEIISNLSTAGELENTLILFTSDNGGLSRGTPGKYKGGHNSNAGLRGSKAQIYEGGHRVPFIARWGNGTQNSLISPNSLSDSLIGLQDIYATLAELTSQPLHPGDGLDSQSFLGSLLGQKTSVLRTSLLIQANNGTYHGQQSKKSVRENLWKLIVTKALKPIELYNLGDDPMESINRIAEESQLSRVERMTVELNRIINSARSTPRFHLNQDINEVAQTKINAKELQHPRASLIGKIKIPKDAQAQNWGGKWKIEGKSPMRISFTPKTAERWNLSSFKLAGIPVQNWESGVTTIEGRLNNGNLTSWSHHAVGFAVAPSWEKITLGFPFPMIEDRYRGSDFFRDQLAKPNGHRVHWRRFFPEDVREIVLDLTSSSGEINVVIGSPILSWQNDKSLNNKLERLPYLDELGQVSAVLWPGKATGLKAARETMQTEFKQAEKDAKERKLSKFGGWIDGPRLNASGRFRTQKVNEKWWLVDPEGYLFFSVGACLTGSRAETLAEPKRE
jgi:arylsulfatase A-like enzyme